MRKRIVCLFLLLLFLLPVHPALAASKSAILNSRCTLDWKGFCSVPSRLTDNSYKTGTDLKNGSTGGIYWTADVPVGLVYWEWIVPPDECRYTFYDKDKQPLSTSVRYREGDRGYLTVPEGACGVTLEVVKGYNGGKCRLTEWHVYDANDVPETIHLWEIAPEKCDIMLVACHADDELVMMGGILPTYVGERGMQVQVVYCYVPEQDRHGEALNGLWYSGLRTLPVFFVIEQKNRLRFEEKLTREIRRFKPEVVITHDIMGEYVQYDFKGQNPQNISHGLVSRNCRAAVEDAVNPTKFPQSAEEYGTWQVKKVYIHLYDKNQVVMDFDTPLSAFDGKTAFEISQEAYAFHKSPQVRPLLHHRGRRRGKERLLGEHPPRMPVELRGPGAHAHPGTHPGTYAGAYARAHADSDAHAGTHARAHRSAYARAHPGTHRGPGHGGARDARAHPHPR